MRVAPNKVRSEIRNQRFREKETLKIKVIGKEIRDFSIFFYNFNIHGFIGRIMATLTVKNKVANL